MTLRSSRMASMLLSALQRAGLSVAPGENCPDAAEIDPAELPAALLLPEEEPCPRRPLAATRHVRRRDWALACYRNSWTPPDRS
jgi:hypothetical protein